MIEKLKIAVPGRSSHCRSHSSRQRRWRRWSGLWRSDPVFWMQLCSTLYCKLNKIRPVRLRFTRCDKSKTQEDQACEDQIQPNVKMWESDPAFPSSDFQDVTNVKLIRWSMWESDITSLILFQISNCTDDQVIHHVISKNEQLNTYQPGWHKLWLAG